ncbi:hypothetical protein PV379_00420 [Streptomyces caniscabiei]|uniref:hypothetical protein n=1 Tax=Streptomyces caniscabiei TaxID=2746961 RepID=UPI0029BCAE24|nr:hypothetical protein [Streptomyces caniscabiei]MDX2775820.1 hypothetical protein [Streptomyces caniscabiei]
MSHDENEDGAGKNSLRSRFMDRTRRVGKRARDLSGAQMASAAVLVIGTSVAVLCRRQIAGAVQGAFKGKRRTGLKARFMRR